MSKKKSKKYPVLTYLCLMLLVCVLFTGVTFSRYTTSQSGSMESTVSRFSCSYDISELSSTGFINSSFYLDNKDPNSGKMNTLRTVTYSVRNYKKDAADAPCGENLKSVLRLYGPYEFISNLAWQLDRLQGYDQTVVTPQIVMGDIIKSAPSGSFNTSNSTSFDAHAYEATDIKLSGGISKDAEGFEVGSIEGSWGNNNGEPVGKFVFNAYPLSKATYSLSFLRSNIVTVNGVQVAGMATTPFIVDFEEKISYCTLDIYLSEQMDFTADISEEKVFKLYFTIVDKITGFDNEEYTKFYDAGSDTVTQYAAGYHYDAKVAVRDADHNVVMEEGVVKTATVRVVRKKAEDGNTAGKYTYYIVPEGNTAGTTLKELTPADDYIYNEDNSDYYSVADLNDIFLSPEKAADAGKPGYMITKCIDKVYNVQFKALFVQTSQSGGAE